MDYLTKRGRLIFFQIVRHIKDADIIADIDVLQLSMLANSFDLFEKAAQECNDKGISVELVAKQGSFAQVRPEYTVMRNEYSNILKLSASFGMNPGDREKIFSGLKKKKRVRTLDDVSTEASHFLCVHVVRWSPGIRA